jgi:hypothetical protein
MSADPVLLSKHHLANPQRWNGYIYVLNAPTVATDPDGRKPKIVIDVFLTYDSADAKSWKAVQRYACLSSLYADRIDLARQFLDKIKLEKEHWDMKRFTALLGPMDIWIEDIVAFIESATKLYEIVETNLTHPRLSRLTRSTLTPD